MAISYNFRHRGNVLHRPFNAPKPHSCPLPAYWPPAAGRLGVSMKPCLRPSKPARSSLFSRCGGEVGWLGGGSGVSAAYGCVKEMGIHIGWCPKNASLVIRP